MNKKLVLSLLFSILINICVLYMLSKLIVVNTKVKEENTKIPIKLHYSQLKNDLPTDIQVEPTPKEQPKKEEPKAKPKIKEQPKAKQIQKQQAQKQIQKEELKKEELKKEELKKEELKKEELKKEEPKLQPKENIAIKQDIIIEQAPKRQRSGLENFLVMPEYETKSKAKNNVDQMIEELYSPQELSQLSNTQVEFLKENLDDITKWTQYYLTKLGYPEVARATRSSGLCIVEFELYPDGFISDVKILKSSQSDALDKNSQFVVEVAHRQYPKPREKTLIRIYVYYTMR